MTAYQVSQMVITAKLTAIGFKKNQAAKYLGVKPCTLDDYIRHNYSELYKKELENAQAALPADYFDRILKAVYPEEEKK